MSLTCGSLETNQSAQFSVAVHIPFIAVATKPTEAVLRLESLFATFEPFAASEAQ